jgi:hypothetical protein
MGQSPEDGGGESAGRPRGFGTVIAAALVRGVNGGLDWATAWTLSPRQLLSFCELIEDDRKARMAQLAITMRSAYHADRDTFKALMDELAA